MMRLGLHVFGQVALGFEGEVAESARVRSEIAVCADVLLQHGWLLAPNATAIAHVSTPSATANVRVFFVGGFVAANQARFSRSGR